jgi:hypothetical protein
MLTDVAGLQGPSGAASICFRASDNHFHTGDPQRFLQSSQCLGMSATMKWLPHNTNGNRRQFTALSAE